MVNGYNFAAINLNACPVCLQARGGLPYQLFSKSRHCQDQLGSTPPPANYCVISSIFCRGEGGVRSPSQTPPPWHRRVLTFHSGLQCRWVLENVSNSPQEIHPPTFQSYQTLVLVIRSGVSEMLCLRIFFLSMFINVSFRNTILLFQGMGIIHVMNWDERNTKQFR